MDNPEQAHDRIEVLQGMNQIPSCEEANDTNVNEQLAPDTLNHQILTDQDIVSLLTRQ